MYIEIILLMGIAGIVHWAMAMTTLEIMFNHENVIGGKGLWGVAIVGLTCIGSIGYLLLHPNES